MASSVVSEGQILAGKYRVERVIGEGGMGVVVAARHLQLDEPVAIKFLLPDVAQNAEAVERFAREGRASIKIKSEHVVRVMDVGTLETGLPYMVMEFLRGGDLSSLLASRGGAIGVAEAIEYVLQASEAIADAHAIGIVHRDLKPANLFLTLRSDGTPCVKVLDFGISKHTGSTSSGLAMTKTTAVMGSPLYMSPEQMSSSRDVDARSDIWALGAILYELLSGHPPFEGETLPQVCSAIIMDQPVSLRSRRADIPEALDLAVARCLEKKREHRFQNIAEFAFALTPFGPARSAHSAERILRVLSSAGLAALTQPVMATANSATAQTAAQTAGAWTKSGTKPGSSNKTAMIGGAAGLLLVTAVASVFAMRALRHDPTTKPSADPAIVTAPVSPPVQSVEPAAITSAPVPAASLSAPVASVPTTSSATVSAAGKTKATTAVPASAGAKKPAVRGKGLDAFSDSK